MHKTTHSITPIYDVNITQAEVYAICRRHHILPQHRQCYWRMVARGEILSRTFGRAGLPAKLRTGNRRNPGNRGQGLRLRHPHVLPRKNNAVT